jgi:uncharacterized membrane protein
MEKREQEAACASELVEPQSAGLGTDEAIFAAQVVSHASPLPSHEWFAQLEQIHPGTAAMILRDFTEERDHQRDIQRRAIDLDAAIVRDYGRYQRHRLWLAACLAFFVLFCGLGLILLNKALYGFTLLVGEIAVLAGVFLTQRLLSDGQNREPS